MEFPIADTFTDSRRGWLSEEQKAVKTTAFDDLIHWKGWQRGLGSHSHPTH